MTDTFEKHLQDQKKAVAAISQWLEQEGFRKGIHGFCQHKTGLPRTPNVTVRPAMCPHNGACTIMVTPTKLILANVPQPYDQNGWEITNEIKFESKEKLKDLLTELVYPDLGEWI